MRDRVNESLVARIAADAAADYAYITFMAASGVLAAVAFLTDSVPLLIGAMVVAPAYPPLALVAFAFVGGYVRSALRGLLISLFGVAAAVLCAMACTWLINALDIIPEQMNLVNQPLLEERVRPGWYSLFPAIAAGVAGTIATVKAKTDTLVGVVASVALIPAGAAGGIALLSGDSARALGGFLLLGINAALIIAFGMLTLLVIRPR